MFHRLRPLIAGLITSAVIATAAAGALAGELEITGAWARATPPGVKNGGGYMTIVNHGAADKLLGASGTVAARIQLHNHVMDDGVMRMRQVEYIEVPMHGRAVLEPGGLHVMFMGLKEQLKPGAMVMLTLTFEKAGEVMVHMPIKKAAGMPAMDHDKMHKHSQ